VNAPANMTAIVETLLDRIEAALPNRDSGHAQQILADALLVFLKRGLVLATLAPEAHLIMDAAMTEYFQPPTQH
jgi:hypothetical protein